MRNYKCVNGQSWSDVCLNTYGSLDYYVKMLNDNSVESDSIPYSGQLIIWDETLTVNQTVRTKVFQNNIIFATCHFNGLYLLNNDGTIMRNNDNAPLING